MIGTRLGGTAHALHRLEESTDPAAGSFVRRVRTTGSLLRADCLHGEVVRKEDIPRTLREAHGLENLYVEDLTAYWRLLYTVVRDDGVRYGVVVEIVDHRTYSKWFPGRGR